LRQRCRESTPHQNPVAVAVARAFPKGSYEADMAKVLGGSSVARVRSLRRALRNLCDSSVLLAVGTGGRRDPHRYCLDPLFAAMVGSKEDHKKACAVVQADPGGNEAANNSKLMLRAFEFFSRRVPSVD
jgi:hypothetical protein